MPLFSIIIPTYNSENTIAKALDSVLSQNFSGYEIILVDGLSTDKTSSIIEGYQRGSKNIHWSSEKDKGIYDALNKALKKANGEWLLFLGSDDSFYDQDVLKNVAEAIEKEAGLQMIYGNVKLNKSIGFNSDSLIYAGEFHSNRLLTANICHQAIFYHRSLFEKFGAFNTKYRLLADWDFNLRCFNQVKHRYLDLIVANFFVGASSAEDNDTAFRKDFVRNMVFQYPYNRRHPFYKKTKRALSQLIFREAFSGRIKNACVAANVLIGQLRAAG